MDRVDDLTDDAPGDDASTGGLHPSDHTYRKGFVFVGLIGDQKCALPHRVSL